MSWKSLITAGLLCVLVSPAFAAPTLSAVNGGTFASNFLDANGNWVWNVQITPDLGLMPIGDATGTPVAAELGFTSSKAGATAAQLNAVTNFDTGNPGKKIFGTEPNSASTGTPAANFDGPIVVNGTGTTISTAIGSVVFTTAGAKDYIKITVPGPTSASLTSTITTSGAYGGNGRIAQITGGTSGGPYTTGNFDTFNNVFTVTALDGDTNLDGHRNGFDTGPFLAGFSAGVGKWFNGDYTGDGLVNGFDTGHLLAGLAAGPPGSGSGGSLGSSNVPEPASIALIGLAMLGGLGLVGRKR